MVWFLLVAAAAFAIFPLFTSAYALMAACVVGAVALKFIPETAGCSIRGTEIPSVERDRAEAAR